MSAMEQRGDQASGNEGVGRFLCGTITERFLLLRRGGEVPGAVVALSAAPITVTLTDPVRAITDTIPAGRVTDVGAAIASYTITIPAITATITDSVTNTVTVIP